jgi:hypothetical protein
MNQHAQWPPTTGLIGFTLAMFAMSVAGAWGLTSDRAGHVFSADEAIVLKTTATGTAHWRLSNDYGESIEGTAPVVDGRITIATDGLRHGRYTFEVAGDGKLVGGVAPPLIDLPPDLCTMVFAPFRHHWRAPEEALLWKQIGFWEVRYEFGLSGFNPEKGVYKPNPDMDRYMQALAEHGIRPSFKINGPPRWNDTSTVRGKESEPRSYPDYEETLRTFARHFLRFGMERYYIVNEPEAGGWWAGGWDGYYRFLKSSNKALKEVDPRILTIAPESWSYVPQFMQNVLKSGAVDVVSGHYPIDEQGGNVHGAFYFTEMRKAGVWLPFINGEDFYVWTPNLEIADWRKLYPGIVGGITGGALVPTLLVSLDVGAYRTVALHLQPNGQPAPFARYAEDDILVTEQLFQNRAANEALAGAQFRSRIPDAPINVMGWLYRRGNDNFAVAYAPVGKQSQLMEITTSSPRLRIVDTFGNSYSAQPVNGKLRVLLSNVETYIHGLGSADTFAFIPETENRPPQIADPGPVMAAVGVPFSLKLDGFDSEMDLTRRRHPRWSLVSAPDGMTIRPGSGLIQWTPQRAGSVSVVVRLTDPDGAAADRTFSIQVLPEGSNLPPRFVSRSTPAAVINGTYRYSPKALDPNGDPVSYSVQGPAGMTIADGTITWTPQALGPQTVRVTASDGRGGSAVQEFELVVCPNPDRPGEGMWPPRMPTDLIIADSDGSAVTLVWNRQSPGQCIVQRSSDRNGPWQEIAATEATWHIDRPPAGPVFYRVLARNAGGDSEPSPVVNGRNRAPIADAGPSRRLARSQAGTAVELDGTASMDPEGQPLRYQWSIVNALREARVSLENATAPKARFTADAPGRYLLSLTVSDGQETSRPDFTWVVIGGHDLDRTTYAGPTRFMTVGQSISLSMSGSPAAKKDNIFWRMHTLPFDGYFQLRRNDREPQFRPEVPGVYQVMVFAIDDWMYGFPDLATVVVRPPGRQP